MSIVNLFELLGKVSASSAKAYTPKEAILLIHLNKGDVPKLKGTSTVEKVLKSKIRPEEFFVLNGENGSLVFAGEEVSLNTQHCIIAEIINDSFSFDIYKESKWLRNIQFISGEEGPGGKEFYSFHGQPLPEEAGFDQKDKSVIIPLIKSISGMDIQALDSEAELLHFRKK